MSEFPHAVLGYDIVAALRGSPDLKHCPCILDVEHSSLFFQFPLTIKLWIAGSMWRCHVIFCHDNARRYEGLGLHVTCICPQPHDEMRASKYGRVQFFKLPWRLESVTFM